MKKIHFIAIGGAVMHQLALALLRQGNIVTGSDDDINDPAKTNLEKAGILPEKYGWFPNKITNDIDAIVLGMHAKADNSELLKAQELNIPIYSFPEYVYEVSKNKKRVVIAGSHGKTTITSMVMHVLKACGLTFDYLVGAKVPGFDSSVQLTDAPIIVLEGDEYPASVIEKRPKIFFYKPHITLLSGIAWDHINVFPTYENYVGQFEHYVKTIEDNNVIVYNTEDSEVVKVVNTFGKQLERIGYATPQYQYIDGETILMTPNNKEVSMQVFGKHNLQNVMGAYHVCQQLGISQEQFFESIRHYSGAARRLEFLIEKDNYVAYRDFAHAPSKLKATISAVREAMKGKKLIAIFELHTYSSLNNDFLNQYQGAMNDTDIAIVYYSNHALQLKGLPTLNTQSIIDNFARQDIMVMNQPQQLVDFINQQKNDGTPICFLLMSSGTFDGAPLLEILQA